MKQAIVQMMTAQKVSLLVLKISLSHIFAGKVSIAFGNDTSTWFHTALAPLFHLHNASPLFQVTLI
jgi:hypothetical protein